MYKPFIKISAYVLLTSTLILGGCSSDDEAGPDNPEEPEVSRWVTVAGGVMGDNPGDGNGGTLIYAVSYEDAINPETTIDLYQDGTPVRSNRTARLQVSEDGSTLFNIAYGGDNGGDFSRFTVNGGSNYEEGEERASIAQYAGSAPRWGKLYDGDQTGIAVNVANIAANNATDESLPFEHYRGTATVLALDLEDVSIANYQTYPLPLTAEEELAGHCIFRIDAPVLNAAGDKLIIGTWMRKYDPATGERESEWNRLGTKSVVVDYPTLENPTIISSTNADGDCSGYRSNLNFLAEDGYIYQATQRDTDGSHILRISPNNEYDNAYSISLDDALGVDDVYVETWRYVANGIGYIAYRLGDADQSYVARVDLNNQTAERVTEIPDDADLDLFQYQGWLVNGTDLLMAITPVGKDGHIYIMNSVTGEVTTGATLINRPGNHYVGVF